MSLRVSIVEDNVRTRNGLQALLDGTPGFSCVSVHASGEDALRHLPEHRPDVVVVDLKLKVPGMSGIDCVRKLRATYPKLQFLVLTEFDDPDLIFDALKAGAGGYLLKRTPPAEIIEAIGIVASGGSTMTPSVARKVLNYFQTLPSPSPSSQILSKREAEVLQLAKRGFSYERIAKDLGIEFNTVRTHFRNIYLKLEVNSRAQAVAKYFNF